MSDKQLDRTPRASKTRSAKPRRQPWKPPSLLDAPPPPEPTEDREGRPARDGKTTDTAEATEPKDGKDA